MRWLLGRLALFIGALAGMSMLIFICLRVLPGDVASVMAGLNAPPERVASLRAELGLDRPLTSQYADWITGLLHGDLGVSMLTGRPTTVQVAWRAQVTFPLILMGLAVALAAGVPLGCAAVLAGGNRLRQTLHMVSIVGGAVPALWSALLLIMLFARGTGLIGLLPAQGFPADGWRQPGAALASLTLPALSVGLIVGAGVMRYTRAALADLASTGFIDLGMACGLTRRQAMLRIGLRLAVPQLVSVVGLTFAEMITGVMVVENLFDLPGLGQMLITDVGNRDLISVQGELLLLAAFFLAVGLIVDLLHRAFDPRLRDAPLSASPGEGAAAAADLVGGGR